MSCHPILSVVGCCFSLVIDPDVVHQQGVKFDRAGVTAGEAIAVLGDQHLARLEDECKRKLASILCEKEKGLQGQSKDRSSVSRGPGHTDVALAFTEVLQLQVCLFSLSDVMLWTVV